MDGRPATARDRPELVELFIEEAKEEVAKHRAQLPMWDADPREPEALITVRRSFHTLKGSGRMVGAQLIGEFAWSDREPAEPAHQPDARTDAPRWSSSSRRPRSALPELIEQLEKGARRKPTSRASSKVSTPSPA